MTPDALLALFEAETRGPDAALGDGAPVEVDGPVRRVSYPAAGFIAAPRDTGLRGAALDALIARQRDAFLPRGLPVEWKTYAGDAPADLTDRLVAAGFVAEERETVLVGAVEGLTGLPADVDGIRFRTTTAAADLDAIGALHSEVWGEDWSWIAADLGERIAALGEDGIRVLLAEDGDRLVSAAWLVMRPGRSFAGLWGGSTLASHRGRGIYRALVARPAAIARDAGIPYLQVDASEMSRPILERLGFVVLTTTTPYVASP